MLKRTMYAVFGVLAIIIGAAILVWILYNLFIERQRHFQPPDDPMHYLFPVFMIGGGVVMLLKGVMGRNPFLPEEKSQEKPDEQPGEADCPGDEA